MGERAAIERTERPVTITGMVEDLRALGVEPGDTLLVHASLSALGWVCGGAQAVVAALREAVGETGTVVVPTHTGQYTDPADWEHPPIPEGWIGTVRASMPAFDPAVTACRTGAVPESLRVHPGAVRSDHPTLSFAALGADAAGIVADHPLDDALGEHSPLAEVYDRAGRVLLLGVGHEANTSLHLAEYRADIDPERVTHSAPVRRDGERVRVAFENIALDDADFPELGAAFEAAVGSARGPVGEADALLHDQPALVEFAVDWLARNR
jgi:aminoglycoside 3-N-acetyltransferase